MSTTTTVTVTSSTATQPSTVFWCDPNYPYMCFYFPQLGYCYPGYSYNCYPGYPNYPNYPGYAFGTMTTVTYSSYSTYSATYSSGTSPATTIPLTPAGGTTVHDIWLIVTQLQGGQFAVVLSAQGLQAGGTYLIQGITSGAHMSVQPLASTAVDSEFVAGNNGSGLYWHVFATDPRTAYGGVLLLYLSNNQMGSAELVASATLD
ncbi:MAG: hypothetical protein ABSD49_14190 [Candidatus Bathyarchaeia archaeon]